MGHNSAVRPACLFLGVLLSACGARTGADLDEPRGRDGGGMDAGRDAGRDGGRDGGVDGGGLDAGPDASFDGGCVPVDDGCQPTERCTDGSDDDCDGQVDEGCMCEPGAVQDCFAGPPGRRDVGACSDGTQVCTAEGTWGDCEGGILPREDLCTGRDDLCNGCSQERICPIDCPEEGDPRVPLGTPFAPYELHGRDFYVGPAARWQWQIEGGPCDHLSPSFVSFELDGSGSESAVFTPRLSGGYTVTLRVTTPGGEVLECSWIVDVVAPGLRIEMCYPESDRQDLDLFLHRPDDTGVWYTGTTAFDPNPDATCGWHNCEAIIRGMRSDGTPLPRADWGYSRTPLERCVNGPLGDRWRDLGACANPRLDIDNNLSEGTGIPENINVDNPREGDTFRIMVQNFTGTIAHPVVNVYCGGRRVATYGQEPDRVPRFRGPDGYMSLGAMWRVADVTTHVDASGEVSSCDLVPLHPPGTGSGYDVTVNDPRY